MPHSRPRNDDDDDDRCLRLLWVPPNMPPLASDPVSKPSLIRRVTAKLNISLPSKHRSEPPRPKPSLRSPQTDRQPPPPPTHSPSLPNSFVSRERREAALRERGLLPPHKDLSQQEQEADDRLGPLPTPPSPTFANGATEAEHLKASWLAANASDSKSLDPDGPRRSTDSRQSVCGTLPRLSTSHLEVLHEEPSEHGPITPCTPPPLARPPIIVSSPTDDSSSRIMVESPISYAFSSPPGSTLDSHSGSDHTPFGEKGNMHAVFRRRTTDSGDRSRKNIRPSVSLTRLGTRSLSNLQRSVAIGRTNTRSSADLSTCSAQAPRTAISPRMHDIGSIIRETRGIEDAESRRLSELAFLE